MGHNGQNNVLDGTVIFGGYKHHEDDSDSETQQGYDERNFDHFIGPFEYFLVGIQSDVNPAVEIGGNEGDESWCPV